MQFEDRADGGRRLAEHLIVYQHQPDVLVLALPRGGVPVGAEVAKALDAPLDVFMVRKLGVPGQEELALGAVATGGVRVLNHVIIQNLNISQAQVDAITAAEQRELERRQRAYRDDRPLPQIEDRTVILVDDGLATGATMYAAVLALQRFEPARLIVGVPTASPETCDAFSDYVDEIICAITPEPFVAVGAWYRNFDQTTDDEVRTLLAQFDH